MWKGAAAILKQNATSTRPSPIRKAWLLIRFRETTLSDITVKSVVPVSPYIREMP